MCSEVSVNSPGNPWSTWVVKKQMEAAVWRICRKGRFWRLLLAVRTVALTFVAARPQRMHGAVQWCGLLLPMFRGRHGTCAKTDEPIEIPFLGWTRYSGEPKKPWLCPHTGANGVSWPPGKMDEKLKSENMQKEKFSMFMLYFDSNHGRQV